MHLVSTVTGLLAEHRTALDAVTACFPGNPLRCTEGARDGLIEEVEMTRRGLYGGVVGYLDFAGNADFRNRHPDRADAGGHRVCAGRRRGGGRFQRPVRYTEAATRPPQCCAIAAAETLRAP